MKCDKCGFEHNSRSTCPKCGARVVYVNEDYERRRREWEEAQRNGTGSGLPPGIMHSTREEHDMKTGRDRMINVKQEGGSEMTGLSFAVFKDKIINLLAKIIVWFKKHKKKRGRNNPVVRKLEFSNKPDILDTSKLVLSHKKFKDNRKWILLATAVIIVLGIGIPVTIHNIKRIDHSEVVYVTESGIFSTKNNKALFEFEDFISATEVGENSFFVTTEKSVVTYNNGHINTIEIDKPEVITYNDRLSAFLIMSNHSIYFYGGRLTETGIAVSDLETSGCMVSDNGKYYVLTTLENGKEEVVYDMYYGNLDETKRLSSDDRQKVVLDVYDDGSFFYLDMDNAEYGIVNDRAITFFDGIDARVLAADCVEYRYKDAGDIMYFTDKSGYLYIIEDMKISKIDYNVHTFCDNELDDLVYYLKDDGCYLAEKNADYRTPLFKTNNSELTLFYNCQNNYMYVTDMTGVYFVGGIGKGSKNEKICDIAYGDKPIFNDSGDLYVVSANSELIKLEIVQTTMDSDVSNFILMDNSKGFAYEKAGKRYISYNAKDVMEMQNVDLSKEWQELIYSKKCAYYIDESNGFYKVTRKNDNINKIADVKICIFVG